VKQCASLDELRAAMSAIGHYFGWEPTPEDVDRFAENLDVGRMHAARDDGAIVGAAGAFGFDLAVPGGRVRTAGITLVGVLPTYRRRGVLTSLMRTQLDDIHERGEPLAYLWASEPTIYGRFGYGIATLLGDIDLPRERGAFSVPVESGRARIVDEDEAAATFPAIYDAALRPGMFSRSESWWRHRVLDDPEARRRGRGPLTRVLLETDGKAAAYALYRTHASFEGFINTGHVEVVEVVGATPAGTRAIWRFLLDIDWLASFKATHLPLDHVLLSLLSEPRRAGFRIFDATSLRLVDVEAALSQRSYAGDGEITLEVEDAFCPWNAGHWRVTPGGAELTDSPGEIALDVRELGSVYLGGFTFAQLAEAGRVVELEPGALARADELLRSDRAPWCPEIF
jgi:predicted acetyltransferase